MSQITVGSIQNPAGDGAASLYEGVAKAWVNYDQVTPTIDSSLNMSSVTDTSTGVFTPIVSSAFADTTYAIVSSSSSASASVRGGYHSGYNRSSVSKTTTSFAAAFMSAASSANDAAVVDVDENVHTFMGDLA